MYLFWRRVLKRGGGTTAFPISANGRNLKTKGSLYTETQNFLPSLSMGTGATLSSPLETFRVLLII
jgi:hypothetical protein